MWGRRQHFETLVWQTPVLVFTAQSFLFTIILGPETSRSGRIISGLLLLLSGLASLFLMAKHRAFEELASQALADHERTLELPLIHGREGHAKRVRGRARILRLSAYDVWFIFVTITVFISAFLLCKAIAA
jgi:hypothetical protein